MAPQARRVECRRGGRGRVASSAISTCGVGRPDSPMAKVAKNAGRHRHDRVHESWRRDGGRNGTPTPVRSLRGDMPAGVRSAGAGDDARSHVGALRGEGETRRACGGPTRPAPRGRHELLQARRPPAHRRPIASRSHPTATTGVVHRVVWASRLGDRWAARFADHGGVGRRGATQSPMRSTLTPKASTRYSDSTGIAARRAQPIRRSGAVTPVG